MSDDYVVDYLRNTYKCIPFRFLHSTQPEIYKYLVNRFDDCVSLKEAFYRLEHKIYKPICPICGNKLTFNGGKYLSTCSQRECINKWKGIKNKQVFIAKFGCENPWQKPEIKEKIKQTCLEKYGVDNPAKSKEIQEKISKKLSSEEIRNKCNETKIKNKSFNKSNPEDICFNLLKQNFPMTLRQYSSDKYPFAADFYIPEIDTYIEYQGFWTHGFHPFNCNDINDINKLNKWKEKSLKSKFFSKDIYVWTDLDIRKRNIAKLNNINLIEFWDLNDVNKFINNLK